MNTPARETGGNHECFRWKDKDRSQGGGSNNGSHPSEFEIARVEGDYNADSAKGNKWHSLRTGAWRPMERMEGQSHRKHLPKSDPQSGRQTQRNAGPKLLPEHHRPAYRAEQYRQERNPAGNLYQSLR